MQQSRSVGVVKNISGIIYEVYVKIKNKEKRENSENLINN